MKTQTIFPLDHHSSEEGKEICVEEKEKIDQIICNETSPRNLKKRIGSYSYYLNDVIGRGFSSVVYKGVLNSDKSQKVALKVVSLEGMNAHRRQLLDKQINVMKKLRHPNIVKLLDSYFTKNNCYIITEYCDGGSLQGIIDNKFSFEWNLVGYQIGKACQYLSSLRILHRDIKPANVFICNGVYKLGDFGFVYQLEQGVETITEKYVIGSPIYMPKQALEDNLYSLKGDAFAFGVFIYYLISKHFPWKGKDKQQLLKYYEKRQVNMKQLHFLPPRLKHYLKGLLNQNFESRFSLLDLDLTIFEKIKPSASIQMKLKKISRKYQMQVKICEFIYFLMINLEIYEGKNILLLEMMSQHLGQLTEIFDWNKHQHLRQLKEKYIFPLQQYEFSNDHYHWLNNCIKNLIRNRLLNITEGLLLKLLQYQNIVQGILHQEMEIVEKYIDAIILHESFEKLYPIKNQIESLIHKIDFYQF